MSARSLGDVPLSATANGSKQRSILFDLDGTIAKTDDLHFEAFNHVLAPFGRVLTRLEFDEHVSGHANSEIMKYLLPQVTDPSQLSVLIDAKEADYRARASSGIPAVEGLASLLDWAHRQGLSMAIVTNAPRLNADMVLRAVGMRHRFDAVIISDELTNGKPHPLPYLTALERLEVPADQAVAFEDSRSGVRSARAAGVPVLGIVGTLSRSQLVAAGAEDAFDRFDHPDVRVTIQRILRMTVRSL
ncbi:MAG: HAD family hydrolase [Casimicrobiaceae bacterium]